MSMTIDRIIKSAEKSLKFGNLEAAKAELGVGLEAYPENPRLNALSERIDNQVRVSADQAQGLPPKIFKELEFLVTSYQWIILIKRCLELMPYMEGVSDLWNFLGVGQRERGFVELAEISFRRAIELNYSSHKAHSNLGNVLKDQGRFNEAIEAHNVSFELNPADPRPLNNLGNLFEFLGEFDKAHQIFSKAVELDPNFATAEYNLAGMELRQKNFVSGWRRRECRWKRVDEEQELPIETSKPLWNGSFVERLFVWAEQGVGDEIMFLSCLEQLKKQCKSLTISMTDRLIPLFEKQDNYGVRFISRSSALPDWEYDFHVPAQTALGLLRKNLKDFEQGKTPYLSANPENVRIIKSELQKVANGRPIIGLSWFSNNAKSGKQRSIRLEDLVAQIPEKAFLVNLQYGDMSQEIAELETTLGRGIATFGNIDNFAHLELFAALIQACDRVVSIDNSTVHFAGAMGINCDVLLPYSGDWRWGMPGIVSSYWYDSLRLHWQGEPNSWAEAFKSLKKELEPLNH